MAWERNFEARVMKIRRKELTYQKRNYLIEVCSFACWLAKADHQYEIHRRCSTLSGIAHLVRILHVYHVASIANVCPYL